MDREKFALWSFERDLAVGCYDGEGWACYPTNIDRAAPKRWDDLLEEEREVYLKEADHYLTIPEDMRAEEWPDDILERMKKEG